MNHIRMPLIIALLVGSLGMSGCVEMQSLRDHMETTRENRLAEQAATFIDQELLAAYYPDEYHKHHKGFHVGKDFIEIQDYDFLKHSTNHREAVEEYLQTDHSQDEVAKRYINAVTARGNTVHLYKPAVNSRIAQIFKKPIIVANERLHTDLDQAMIEFDKNGRMVSVLYRITTTYPNVATFYYEQYARIYVGANARIIENELRASFLKDFEIAMR